ncbi:hypothetical protein QR680_003163 [Steinernema hermaphroditum]|uniref:Uncharacterized protein n=1 Tax=Steinernema hermaphroditum TaxID=289476 RepID=A0AA39LJK4_9BILA|nr:hypothetical protein QR680_003163 [Steinernema hermaphroditum]
MGDSASPCGRHGRKHDCFRVLASCVRCFHRADSSINLSTLTPINTDAQRRPASAQETPFKFIPYQQERKEHIFSKYVKVGIGNDK